MELATGTADFFPEFRCSSKCTDRNWPSSPEYKSSYLLFTSSCGDSFVLSSQNFAIPGSGVWCYY